MRVRDWLSAPPRDSAPCRRVAVLICHDRARSTDGRRTARQAARMPGLAHTNRSVTAPRCVTTRHTNARLRFLLSRLRRKLAHIPSSRRQRAPTRTTASERADSQGQGRLTTTVVRGAGLTGAGNLLTQVSRSRRTLYSHGSPHLRCSERWRRDGRSSVCRRSSPNRECIRR